MGLYELDRDKWRSQFHSEETVHALRDLEDDECVIDMYSTHFGATVRSCLSCGVLVIGGASRCGFCAYRYGARREGWWDPVWKIMKRVTRVAHIFGVWK